VIRYHAVGLLTFPPPAAGFNTPDGVLTLRADPQIVCSTPYHRSFQNLALGIICFCTVGVPLCYIRFISKWPLSVGEGCIGADVTLIRCPGHLRSSARARNLSSATGAPLLTRDVWSGLGDPSTRMGWGTLYEAYRFNKQHDDDDPPENPGCVMRLRLALLRNLAPSWEALLLCQKLALALVTNLLPDIGPLRALALMALFVVWAALTAFVRPFQRLDVRIPVRLWLPSMPLRWRPADAAVSAQPRGPAAEPAAAARAAEAAAVTHRFSVCGIRCGWLLVTHLFVGDALNMTAISANVVQAVSLGVALAAGGNGETALGFALIGFNLLNLVLAMAAWFTCVVTWRVTTQLLLDMAQAEKEEEDVHERECELHDSPHALAAATAAEAAAAEAREARETPASPQAPAPVSKLEKLCAAFNAAAFDAQAHAEYLSYDDVVRVLHAAGERVLQLTAAGRLEDAIALKRTVEVVASIAMARLQHFGATLTRARLPELAASEYAKLMVVEELFQSQRLERRAGYSRDSIAFARISDASAGGVKTRFARISASLSESSADGAAAAVTAVALLKHQQHKDISLVSALFYACTALLIVALGLRALHEPLIV